MKIESNQGVARVRPRIITSLVVNTMELTVLGSGGFLPQPGRPLPGYAVRHEGKLYLFDAGEGTQVRLVEQGLSSADLEAICLSHVHGDHVFGLPGVMVRRSQEGQRTDPLDLYGPPALETFLSGIEAAGSLGLIYEWSLNTLEDGISFEHGELRLTVAKLDHRIETFGFALEKTPGLRRFLPARAGELGVPEGPERLQLQKGQSVTLESGRTVHPEDVTRPPEAGPRFVYLTDTRPCFELPDAFQNPDLLVHEAMFLSEDLQHARDKKHCTAREAARVAKHLEADQLLLTHFSHRYRDPTVLLEEARETFRETYLARVGDKQVLN